MGVQQLCLAAWCKDSFAQFCCKNVNTAMDIELSNEKDEIEENYPKLNATTDEKSSFKLNQQFNNNPRTLRKLYKTIANQHESSGSFSSPSKTQQPPSPSHLPQIQIPIDITIESYINMTDEIPMHFGLQSTELIKQWIKEKTMYPEYRRVLLLLKVLVKNNHLHKVYNGGISSFMLAVMLAGFYNYRRFKKTAGLRDNGIGEEVTLIASKKQVDFVSRKNETNQTHNMDQHPFSSSENTSSERQLYGESESLSSSSSKEEQMRVFKEPVNSHPKTIHRSSSSSLINSAEAIKKEKTNHDYANKGDFNSNNFSQAHSHSQSHLIHQPSEQNSTSPFFEETLSLTDIFIEFCHFILNVFEPSQHMIDVNDPKGFVEIAHQQKGEIKCQSTEKIKDKGKAIPDKKDDCQSSPTIISHEKLFIKSPLTGNNFTQRCTLFEEFKALLTQIQTLMSSEEEEEAQQEKKWLNIFYGGNTNIK